MQLVIETRLDGSDAPTLIGGQPTGQTMAITRVDATHATTVMKMNGTTFSRSTSTLSPDGRTMTVVNDITSAPGGPAVGTVTEVWVKR